MQWLRHWTPQPKTTCVPYRMDTWLYYHDKVVEKIDLNDILKITESVRSALGFKPGKSWEVLVIEMPKFPWTNVYFISLELDGFHGDLQNRILHAIHDGPNGLKGKDFGYSKSIVECPEGMVRQGEEPIELNFVT